MRNLTVALQLGNVIILNVNNVPKPIMLPGFRSNLCTTNFHFRRQTDRQKARDNRITSVLLTHDKINIIQYCYGQRIQFIIMIMIIIFQSES